MDRLLRNLAELREFCTVSAFEELVDEIKADVEELMRENERLRDILKEAEELLPTHDGFGSDRCKLAKKISKALSNKDSGDATKT